MSRYRVAADIGGTFTDFVVEDAETGRSVTGKVPSTPSDPAAAVLEGLRQLIPDPAGIEFLVHGTTVGLNAFLERRGERVLLITTAGLRDAYSIARGDRRELYTLRYRKPQRLVPRRDVHEVRERLNWDGSIRRPLEEADFEPILEKIRAEGITAVAVCFIHAYQNPVHELRAREILLEAFPNLSVTLSHEVTREWREVERASTAVMNAYIAPRVQGYLDSLQRQMAELGVTADLHVMQSSGGVMTVATAHGQPVQTLMSGPVGGMIGGARLAALTGRPNLICVDMGGTSFDMSLITDGRPTVVSETEIEGLPLLVTIGEIHTIGAGGGSIAWLEAGGLRVGPRSAGADPGPACYGRGGTEPTVTDANLYLGRLGTASLLGGRMALDEAAAARAIEDLGRKLDLEGPRLAEGILAIINAKMADGIRTITVGRGIDPRDYALVAFGGAGPMHAVWLARELQIGEVIVPANPGAFSAWGMLQADLRHDLVRTCYYGVGDPQAREAVAALMAELAEEGRGLLRRDRVDEARMVLQFSADMRYVGQEYTVNVPLSADVDLDEAARRFHEAYQVRYGHSTPGAPVEFVNLRLAALGRISDSTGAAPVEAEEGDPILGSRRVVFEGQSHETPILLRRRLPRGYHQAGPLVVEEETSTTVVPPGYRLRVDDFGNLVITREGRP